MKLSLQGKVALVTGASKGIGRSIASTMAEAGASVLLSSRNGDALQEAADAIEGDVATYPANAGDEEQAERCVAHCIERFGAVDVLVNNAATNPFFGPTIDIDPGRHDKTWQVNFRGPLFWTQFAWRASMAERGGVVINMASVGGISSEPNMGIYNATKAALMHLTRQLAGELGPVVRVNAIAPGVVKTDMARAVWEPREEEMMAALPLRRLGKPADIAAMALFLASPAASWITGQTFVVDGGLAVSGLKGAL